MVDTHTGVPLFVGPTRTEDEEVERELDELIRRFDDALPNNGTQETIDNPPLQWLTQNGTPVNEFTREGYIAMAFPTLFPKGHADLNDNVGRNESISIAEYFDALLKYKDGRFGSHPRYHFHRILV